MALLTAHIALFAYPVVALILFRRLGLVSGLIWTILAGYLFLPVRPVIDLPIPGLPFIDKHFVPALCALIFVGAAQRREARLQSIAERLNRQTGVGKSVRQQPSPPSAAETEPTASDAKAKKGRWMINALVLIAIFGPVLTTLTNGEPLSRGNGIVQGGFRIYDSGRAVITSLVTLLPFFLARRYLRSPEAHRALIRALVIGGICYALLAFYEVRMSPSLNQKIYGFFAHNWLQHLKGGYRPIIFLEHGLRVGIFLTVATILAAVSIRLPENSKRRAMLWGVTGMVFLALLLSKNMGAFVLALFFAPVALMSRPQKQIMIAASASVILLFYPMLRSGHVIPVESVVSLAETIDTKRAASLEFRLTNEDKILERAAIKPILGWGGQGRWFVYDARGGAAIPDGHWVITIGQFGWFGYIAEFGLLTIPILLIAFRRKVLPLSLETAGLALALTANVIDLIPNSGLTPITWLLAGSLAGWYETSRSAALAQPQGARDRRPVREPLRAGAAPARVRP